MEIGYDYEDNVGFNPRLYQPTKEAPCRLCGKEAALGLDGLCESCEQIREALEG